MPTVKNPKYFRDAFNAVQELIKQDLVLAGHDISAGGLITTLLEMTFANTKGGLDIDLSSFSDDIVKNLLAENPGVVIQVKDADTEAVENLFDEAGISFAPIGKPGAARKVSVKKDGKQYDFDIEKMRDAWYKTSHLLDRRQSFNGTADERAQNYKNQPLEMKFNADFQGTLAQYGLSADRWKNAGDKDGRPRAAIIREKGTNGEREMAYTLWLAGFEVKDVMMTDLITGRETLERHQHDRVLRRILQQRRARLCQGLGRCLPLQPEGKGSPRQVLRPQGHPFTGYLQRLSVDD